MRMRYRKKVINLRALLDIRLGKLIAELNQTMEEAYRSLDEVLDEVLDPDDAEQTADPRKVSGVGGSDRTGDGSLPPA